MKILDKVLKFSWVLFCFSLCFGVGKWLPLPAKFWLTIALMSLVVMTAAGHSFNWKIDRMKSRQLTLFPEPNLYQIFLSILAWNYYFYRK